MLTYTRLPLTVKLPVMIALPDTSSKPLVDKLPALAFPLTTKLVSVPTEVMLG